MPPESFALWIPLMIDTKLNSVSRLIAALILAVAAEHVATAATFTYINGEGFESPAYTTTFLPAGPGTYAGQVVGQSALIGGDTTTAPWKIDFQTSFGAAGPRVAGTATIQDTVPGPDGFGQSLEVVRGENSDEFYGVLYETTPIAPYVCVEWDMMIPDQLLITDGINSFGPLFGSQAFDDQGVIGTLGGLYADAATREVVYQVGDGLAISSFLVDYDVWYKFQMVLDFSTDTYSVFVNGVLIDSGIDFVDPGLDEFSDSPIFSGAGFSDPVSAAATGTAFFDNYNVFETDMNKAIPEPSTIIILVGISLTSFAYRRKFT